MAVSAYKYRVRIGSKTERFDNLTISGPYLRHESSSLSEYPSGWRRVPSARVRDLEHLGIYGMIALTATADIGEVGQAVYSCT